MGTWAGRLGCWAGGGGAGRQALAGQGRAGLEGGKGGRASVLGTSGMCLKSCKRYGVKNARG